jgi:hypothetical protein
MGLAAVGQGVGADVEVSHFPPWRRLRTEPAQSLSRPRRARP